MTVIALLAPMKQELEGAMQFFPTATKITNADLEYYEIKKDDKTIIIYQCGVGKVNASIAVMKLYYLLHVNIIINLGSAGGMKVGQHICDLVIGSQVCYHQSNSNSTNMNSSSWSTQMSTLHHLDLNMENY